MTRPRSEPIVDFGHRPPSQANAPVPAVAPPPPPVSETFRKRAEQWKRQLLDVTRRNRGIHYRPTRSSLTVPAAACDVWDALVAAEGEVSFAARAFAPDSANPAEDDRAKDAFAAATRLIDRARLADREQGIQVLFCALGWLNWVDSDGTAMRSPLALVPVELEYDRQGQKLTARAAGDDEPEVNPSLAYLLQAQSRLRLPRLDDAEGAPIYPSLAAFIAAVQEVVANQPGWFVEEEPPLIDIFAFANLAIVDEIDRSLPRLASHPVLQALAGETSAPPDAAPTASPAPLDERLAPGALRTVVDADAYQLEAVAMAAAGGSFVIEGPPGTGKSQTITNIIAELLAAGKTVLFVAEKRVAREVVFDNLTKAGLGEACLHLAANANAASKADTKAQVIQQIIGVTEGGVPVAPPDAQLPARVAELRQRLNAYAAAIATPLGDGAWTTPYEVFGTAAALRPAARPSLAVPPIAGLSRFWLDDVLDEARELDKLSAAELAVMAGPWAGLAWPAATAEQCTALREALAVLAGAAAAADERIKPLLPAPASPTATTPPEADGLAARLEAVAAYNKLSGSLLRFVRPAYYGARTQRSAYLAAGYRETGSEAATAASLRSLLASHRGAVATAAAAFPALNADAPLAETAAWAQSLADNFESLPTALEVNAILARLEPLGMRAAAATLLRDATAYGQLAAVLRASVYTAWATELAAGPLATTPDQHDRTVASFGRVDAEILGWGRSSALTSLRGRRPAAGPNHPAFTPLLKYARAKRRPSLRIMLANTREAVQTLKPCLLMSPLAAAQYLCQEGAGYTFDAVIVDEASMIPTPDLVVALSLGRQAIISGDSKQMPPTNFFNKEIAPAAEDDPDEPDVTFESVLDECAPILPSTMLRAHYRSRDDALIAFSNVYFYDGRLIAFPDPWESRPETGVRFEYVGDAVYGRGGSRANAAEAKRAIELLRAELAASHGEKQVAITAMSLAQQQEVLAQLQDAAMLDPVLRGWLDGGGQVRNLETVQGDECDVMILSIGYGKDVDGRLTLNFGPLGQEKGERRLNVAITRARWKTIVVSSLRAADIDPARTNSTGTLRLRDYLDYAERGPAALVATAPALAAGEPTGFERVVAAALEGAGLKCQPRVGVGGYHVDLGVLHPQDATRFVLGIECDGPAYSGAPAARDRDLGRARVLERMGWNLERAWSAAWFRNPEAELERLLVRYRALIAGEARGAP